MGRAASDASRVAGLTRMALTPESTKDFRIRGVIRLAQREMFDDATAIVGLDDVTMIDAPSRRVAEKIIEHVRGLQTEIPFELTARFEPSASASYVLSAEIRLGAGDPHGPADHVSTIACPWSPADVGRKTVPVRKIRPAATSSDGP